MRGDQLRKIFSSSHTVVLPVIHVLDHEQTSRNIDIAIEKGAAGVFLINHDFDVDVFLPIIRSIRIKYPSLWLGVNFLAVTAKFAFPILSELGNTGTVVNGYWADDARIDENRTAEDQPEAEEILLIKQQCGWDGLYFGGTAFKKQRVVDESLHLQSAMIASRWMDVVTTSGVATGKEAGTDKVEIFRQGVGESALALASGITPDNVMLYAEYLDAILVATGVNLPEDFYNIDPDRLDILIERIRRN
jgi:predicted TIM-barrel enzyme